MCEFYSEVENLNNCSSVDNIDWQRVQLVCSEYTHSTRFLAVVKKIQKGDLNHRSAFNNGVALLNRYFTVFNNLTSPMLDAQFRKYAHVRIHTPVAVKLPMCKQEKLEAVNELFTHHALNRFMQINKKCLLPQDLVRLIGKYVGHEQDILSRRVQALKTSIKLTKRFLTFTGNAVEWFMHDYYSDEFRKWLFAQLEVCRGQIRRKSQYVWLNKLIQLEWARHTVLATNPVLIAPDVSRTDIWIQTLFLRHPSKKQDRDYLFDKLVKEFWRYDSDIFKETLKFRCKKVPLSLRYYAEN